MVKDLAPVAHVLRLRSVELRVPTLSQSVDFYSEAWGLDVVERDRDAAWLRGTGPQHHSLALRVAEANALGVLSFAVATVRDVDGAARNLEDRGIPILAGPGRSDGPEGGYRVRFCDPEGRLVELSAETLAVPEVSQDAARPLGVTHVVLNTAGIDRSVEFWTDVMGFRLSDWSEHQMAFLRCNSDHHAVAFNQGRWASLNHVAWEMTSIDAFMRGIGRLRHHGVVPQWGPGRHGPGNNTFSYFVDPASLVCEYTSEVQQIPDGWVPRVWRRVPELSDLWGTAGPPSEEVRRNMAGSADDGAFSDAPELRSAFASATSGAQ